MKNGKLYPVAYDGELFLKRNIIGNFYVVNERFNIYAPVGIVEAINVFSTMPNTTISFESAFELE